MLLVIMSGAYHQYEGGSDNTTRAEEREKAAPRDEARHKSVHRCFLAETNLARSSA